MNEIMYETTGWFNSNAQWLIPTTITILFSIINVRYLMINSRLAESMEQLQKGIFCYNLMDRRLSVYEAIGNHISKCLARGDVDDNWFRTYRAETKTAKFLFGEDICSYIKEIEEQVNELHLIRSRLNDSIKNQTITADHVQQCEREEEIKTNIYLLSSNQELYFQRYIDFSGCKIKNNIKFMNCVHPEQAIQKADDPRGFGRYA